MVYIIMDNILVHPFRRGYDDTGSAFHPRPKRNVRYILYGFHFSLDIIMPSELMMMIIMQCGCFALLIGDYVHWSEISML